MAAIKINPLTLVVCPAVARVVNEAFLVDAFFKKEEFKNRIDDEGKKLLDMVAEPNHSILVATDGATDDVVGAIHVHWQTDGHIHGGFGMLAVTKMREKGGIGKSLVRAAEDMIYKELSGKSTEVVVEIPIINVRPDVIPWYERQGYSKTGEIRPFEVPHIIADGYDIKFIMMNKILTPRV